jgi:hypothetical protein
MMEDKQRSPEGMSQDARDNVPSQVSYDTPPLQPEVDSLPLDGSLTLNDTDPIDQGGLHDEDTRILRGSEASQTAGSATGLGNVEPPDQMDNTANTMGSE